MNKPWGGGNQFLQEMSALLKSQGHEVVYKFSPNIDILFIINPKNDHHGFSYSDIHNYKKVNPDSKIIFRVNECDKRKGGKGMDNLIKNAAKISDEIVFISEWLQGHFKEKGVNKKSHVITNGCNSNHFYPSQDTKIEDNIKLVTHHWSDNWMKGFDIYTEIDKYLLSSDNPNFKFTYVGRYFNGYKPQNTTIVPPTHGESLGEELRKHDIYVTASRWEPGGMHHIEGAASGLPVVYHKEGGGINELCEKHGESFSDFDEMLEKINLIKNNYKSYVDSIDHDNLSSKKCCKNFLDVINNMMQDE